MTACVNKKSKRVAAVVTASLVGALSIGAPAVALAANADITLQTATDVKAFDNAKMEYMWVDGKGVNGKSGDDYVDYETNVTGDNINFVVSALDLANGVHLTGLENSDDYKQTYVTADEKGEPTDTSVAKIIDPGLYFVKVEAVAGLYEGGVCYVPVTVKGTELKNLSAFEVNPLNKNDYSDTGFIFNGSELNVGILLDGKTVLTEGVDYEVKFLPEGANVSDPGVEVKNIGKYWGVVTGLGAYRGQSATLELFKVTAFDLANGTVTVDPIIGSDTYANASYTVTYTDSDGRVTSLDTSYTKLVLTDAVFGDNKEYTTFKVVDADLTDPNVFGENGNFTVDKYAKAATFKYDGAAWSDTFKHDLSDEASDPFDTDEISAYDENGKKLDRSGLDIKVYDASGKAASSDWQTTAGTYTVKATYKGSDHKYGGSVTCVVTVIRGSIDADASAFVNYKGSSITSLVRDWTSDGINTSDFSVVVKDEDGKTLKKGTDYAVAFKDANGRDVTEFSDAGEYTIEISSDKYELSGTTVVKVTINKLDLSKLALDGETKFNYTFLNVKGVSDVIVDNSTILYTEGVDMDADKSMLEAAPLGVAVKLQQEQGDGTWKDVKKATADKTAHYRAIVTAGNVEIEKNCVFASEDGTVLDFWAANSEDFKFADVKPCDWFFNAVADAEEAGIMNGYGNRQVFGPNDQLKRGQVAVILYNMAGSEDIDGLDEFLEGSYNELIGWTSFDDVNGKEYYGKAIAWAKQAGVVNGYADGTFRPESYITREEFAAMLANFAKKFNEFDSVDADKVLGSYADASSVSDWAKDAVAWAVDSKIMGKGGSINPASNITRGEAAAMSVDSDLKVEE